MADDLYDRDFYAWTQVQAEALRARRTGDNALDYDNLAEEIEDVGKSELRACQSYVERIIEHLIKLAFVGPPEAERSYMRELRAFRRNLGRTITPTLERKLSEQLGELIAEVVSDMATEGVLGEQETAAVGSLGLTWAQIRSEWYPEPRMS